MSLGLTRDSVLDLANLAAEKSKQEEQGKHRPGRISMAGGAAEVGQSSEVAVDDGIDVKSDESIRPGGPREQSPSSSYGQYSEFSANQSDYENYYADPYGYHADPYAPIDFGGKRRGTNPFCCLFPGWLTHNKTLENGTSGNESADTDKPQLKEKELPPNSAMHGGNLDNNNNKGRLSGRPGSNEPNAPVVVMGDGLMKDGLLNKTQITDDVGAPREKLRQRGILKRSSVVSMGSRNKEDDPSLNGRRSLFPQYEEKPKPKGHHCRFTPMARVVAIRSRKDMDQREKSEVWWQKMDYEDFKKTGRLIAKAMLEGGSEVWLATNKSWQVTKPGSISRIKSDQVTSSTRLLFERKMVMNGKASISSKMEDSDKWWHKFDHSRRGLEHIASIEEGRQRQQNVRSAIRAVVDEQKRQKIYGRVDGEKLRMLSLQYTSWARDLAFAAAASDAEAVKGNFQPDRKTREFYLLKHAMKEGGFSKQLPAFMMPPAVTPQMLDANTSSQLRYKRQQSKSNAIASGSQPRSKTSSSPELTMEAIRDNNHPTKGSIAKRAAAFGTSSGADMAAVLSGMGSQQ